MNPVLINYTYKITDSLCLWHLFWVKLVPCESKNYIYDYMLILWYYSMLRWWKFDLRPPDIVISCFIANMLPCRIIQPSSNTEYCEAQFILGIYMEFYLLHQQLNSFLNLLQPSVDIKTVLSQLMDRLSNYAASSPEVSIPISLVQGKFYVCLT